MGLELAHLTPSIKSSFDSVHTTKIVKTTPVNAVPENLTLWTASVPENTGVNNK